MIPPPAPPRLGSVLVTGATSPLGAAIVRALAPHADRVLLHTFRRLAEAEDLARGLVGSGCVATPHCCDLREDSAVRALAAAAGPRLDLLVHNAALYHRGALRDLTPATLDDLLAVNLKAPLLLTSAALTALQASRGQVIFVADVGGVIPWSHHAAYGATKAAVAWLVRSLALELAPDLRVNGIAPGLITAPPGSGPEQRERLEQRVPMKRGGSPEEVAEAVRWFAVGSGYVTGQVLSVDGGRTAGRGD